MEVDFEKLEFEINPKEKEMNYFMLDGKKIEMSDETADSLRKSQKTPEQRVIDEFLGLMPRFGDFYSLERPIPFKIFIEDNYLYIETPSSNSDWSEELFKAIIKFSDRDDRWHQGSKTLCKPGYLCVRLSPKSLS